VNVLFVDGEVSEGQDLCVELSNCTAGKDGGLDVFTVAKSDVVFLTGGVSSGLVVSEFSAVFPVLRVGVLVNAETILNKVNIKSFSRLKCGLRSLDPVTGEVGEIFESGLTGLGLGVRVIVLLDGVDTA